MKFWLEVVAAFLGYALAGWIFVLFYLALQWFLQATDLTIGYNWSREGTSCHPIFEIRNRSKSRTYRLAGIEYSNGKDRLVWFDNKSLMGKELQPGTTIEFPDVAPLRNNTSISECLKLRVAVRLQSGKRLWLRRERHAQMAMESLRQAAFKLRDFIDE